MFYVFSLQIVFPGSEFRLLFLLDLKIANWHVDGLNIEHPHGSLLSKQAYEGSLLKFVAWLSSWNPLTSIVYISYLWLLL